ncbi:MAG: hypothetical protein Q8P79_00255 [Nanoarchaeota archaeon]|nr:hypothetical protein [Nanoarchaeota archaeon]
MTEPIPIPIDELKANPIDELKALLPSLEGRGRLLPADIVNINEAIKTAERANGNGKNGELYGQIRCLERIADFDFYYQSNPEAQELYRKAVGLLGKV